MSQTAPSLHTALAGFTRLSPTGETSTCRPSSDYADLVLRSWYGQEDRELAPISVVGERMIDALIRVAESGSESVKLLGDVETPHPGLDSATQIAAQTGDTYALKELRHANLWVRGFSMTVDGDCRAELRSDGVVFVYTNDRDKALSIAAKVLECALGSKVHL